MRKTPHLSRLLTFEIFDQSDEETQPDQKKDNYKDKYIEEYNGNDKDKFIQRAPSKSDPRDLRPLRHLIRVMRGHDLTNKKTMTKTKKMISLENTIKERP